MINNKVEMTDKEIEDAIKNKLDEIKQLWAIHSNRKSIFNMAIVNGNLNYFSFKGNSDDYAMKGVI